MIVDARYLLLAALPIMFIFSARCRGPWRLQIFSKEVKASSSKWVKTKGGILGRFSWQNGYGAFSVGQTEVERVTTYIRNQDEHHRHKTFQDEYRSFLKDYQIEYDEQYVWD